jgi:predicted nucleic acid-binding protein
MSVIFDTNIHIGYKVPLTLHGTLVSMVVLHELVGGAPDRSVVEAYRAFKVEANKSGRLLTPTMEDWWEAGRVLYALRQGLKSQSKGRTPSLPVNEVQRIIRDVLIARTVRRAQSILVTDNIKDFEQIARFCAVRVISGKDFFS